MEINLLGNTDYNSYTIDINLSSKDIVNLSGSGSVIAINEKPNIDLDLNLNDFRMGSKLDNDKKIIFDLNKNQL